MKLIGIAGPARSGKSTVAAHLSDSCGFIEYAFAEPIKRALAAMFELSEWHLHDKGKEQVIPWLGVTPRRLAQTLGTDWGRELIRHDLWIRCAGRWLDTVPRFYPGVVFSDIRFDDEADFVRYRGGLVIHLRRDDAPAVEAHASEDGVTVAPDDYVVQNNGTFDELFQRIDDLVAMA